MPKTTFFCGGKFSSCVNPQTGLLCLTKYVGEDGLLSPPMAACEGDENWDALNAELADCCSSEGAGGVIGEPGEPTVVTIDNLEDLPLGIEGDLVATGYCADDGTGDPVFFCKIIDEEHRLSSRVLAAPMSGVTDQTRSSLTAGRENAVTIKHKT